MTPQATGTTHPDPDHEAFALTPLVPNDDAVTLISDSEIPEKPTSHTRTGEDRTNFWAILPLILHFVVVIVLIVILRTYIDGHHFNLEVRSSSPISRPPYQPVLPSIESLQRCGQVQCFGAASSSCWEMAAFL